MAIAQAYMRVAGALVLYKPIAAWSPRVECEVLERFRELSVVRSALLVSERVSSVRVVDRFLVLSDARIELPDIHATLLAAGKTYAELFQLQVAG